MASVTSTSSTSSTSSTGSTQAPLHRTRIKICGLSRAPEIEHAVALGVDAVGLVFYPPSRRSVSIDQARELARHVAPFVSLVGLFVNADDAWLQRITDEVPLSLLQFHGDETPERCRQLAGKAGLPWLRALRVGAAVTPADLVESALDYACADGLLLDAMVDGFGGGGKVFDWSLIPEELGHRAVLSGGLNAQNVLDAVRRVRPYAVDVSSGVEVPGTNGPTGVKDHDRMTAFVRAVREADNG
jgi:phosphoribosylanthranilate isomerase